MIPELRLGVAVLTNQESGAAFESIVYHVLDHYLGAKAPDYPASYQRSVAQGRRRDARRWSGRRRAARDSTSGPSLPLERYAGTYRDAWYGDVTIAQEGKGLVIRFRKTPSLVGDLSPLAARQLPRRAGATASSGPTRTRPSRSIPTEPSSA